MDKERVAILGAGAGGHAMAADLTMRGFTVNLCDLPQFSGTIKRTIEAGKIELTGFTEGVAKINMITTDIKEAIKNAKTIFVVAQSKADNLFAEACAPYVQDGQIIVLGAGNCGSLIFANTFRKIGVKEDIIFSESVSLPYGCRLKDPTHPGGPPHVRM
ncbi:NADP transhydrogenase subunit alpha, partial [Thermodesulfobacteriota bacterium]